MIKQDFVEKMLSAYTMPTSVNMKFLFSQLLVPLLSLNLRAVLLGCAHNGRQTGGGGVILFCLPMIIPLFFSSSSSSS